MFLATRATFPEAIKLHSHCFKSCAFFFFWRYVRNEQNPESDPVSCRRPPGLHVLLGPAARVSSGVSGWRSAGRGQPLVCLFVSIPFFHSLFYTVTVPLRP